MENRVENGDYVVAIDLGTNTVVTVVGTKDEDGRIRIVDREVAPVQGMGMVRGEIKNIEVNERRDIEDADVDAMLKRLIKQTRETLDGSIKAGNDQERTDTLTAQVAILESYLPKQVSGDELAALVDEVLAETGASTKRDMGRVMGALTQKTSGNFDKAAAAALLGHKLA